MKQKLFLLIALTIFVFPGICPAAAPHGIGGFVLGHRIGEYKDSVKMETALPIRYCGYLKEVEIKPIDGFKSGLIFYGCADAEQPVVRIKLKCADSSKEFYKGLLEQFKKRFGKPAEWRGDPFHVLEAWKWSFIDKENHRISLILQHNTQDRTRKIGNCIKLTNWSLIDEQRVIFGDQHPEIHTKDSERTPTLDKRDSNDWSLLVPR